jgi:hypothetical protein
MSDLWYNPAAVMMLKMSAIGIIIVNLFSLTQSQERRFSMKMQEVRVIARQWGVDIRVGRTKQDIIRDIQVKEGYSPCFRTKDLCEEECLWKPDCPRNEAP